MEKPNYDTLDPFTKKLARMLIFKTYLKEADEDYFKCQRMNLEDAKSFCSDKPWLEICNVKEYNGFDLVMSVDEFAKYYYNHHLKIY